MDYGRAGLDLVIDDVNGSGGIGGEPIAIAEVDAVGSIERVIAGARRLAADGCVLILGPSVTDFAVPLMPVLDEIQVPAINWSGSGLARAAWGFQLKVGSLPDEAGFLTRLIAARGLGAVALARDRGPIGDEYAGYLRPGLDGLGVRVVADLEIAGPDDAGRCAEALRRCAPPCIVYLGLGPAGVSLCRAGRAGGSGVAGLGGVVHRQPRAPGGRGAGARGRGLHRRRGRREPDPAAVCAALERALRPAAPAARPGRGARSGDDGGGSAACRPVTDARGRTG